MEPRDEGLWSHEMSEPRSEDELRGEFNDLSEGDFHSIPDLENGPSAADVPDPIDLTKKHLFLGMLNSLAAYIDDGIHDYLKDNALEDYMDHGDFDGDYENLKAIRRVRALVMLDEYPWWDHYGQV
jgi:hypothetical protein